MAHQHTPGSNRPKTVNIKFIDGDGHDSRIAQAPFTYDHSTTLEDMLTFAKARTGRDGIVLQYVNVYHSGVRDCLWEMYWTDSQKSLIKGRAIWDALNGSSTVYLQFVSTGLMNVQGSGGSGGVGARAGLLSQSLCMLHSRICELEHVLI